MNGRLRNLWPIWALGALTLAAYANSFSTDFAVDSRAIILQDPRVRSTTWEGLRHIFSEHYWWPTATSNLYRPLTTLSYWFNYVVLGNEARPLGYHVINFGLHLANVLLLWRLMLCIAGGATVAWLTAAIFAVHPLGVEAVTNLVGRADLFATLSVLAMSLAWLRAEEATVVRTAWGWRTVALACGIFGVLAKENAVMGIAGIGLLTVRREGWKNGIVAFARRGWFVAVPVVLVVLAARWWVITRTPPVGEVYVNNPIAGWSGFLTAMGVLGRYAVLLIWPASLSCDYSYPQIPPFGFGGMANVVPLASLGGIAALAALAWFRRAAWPNVGFGLAWGAVMLLPTSNLMVRIGSIMAERFLYLPLTGFALCGAAALAGASVWMTRVSGKRSAGYVIPAICIAALVARTFVRNFDWKDERAIWASAMKVCPRSFNVQKGFALSSLSDPVKEPELDAAITHLEQARALLDSQPLPIEREDNTVWPELGKAYRIKAEFCGARGDVTAAVQWAERARAVLEKSVAVNRWAGADVKRRYAERGDTEAAARTYGNPRIFLELAMTQLRLNRIDEAQATLVERSRIDPEDPETPILLGLIARDGGNLDIAAARFLEAALLANNNERAWRELVDVYTRIGMTPSPVTLRNGSGNIDAGIPRVRSHLDAALADLVKTLRLAGRTAQAQAWQERAVREFGCRPELFR